MQERKIQTRSVALEGLSPTSYIRPEHLQWNLPIGSYDSIIANITRVNKKLDVIGMDMPCPTY